MFHKPFLQRGGVNRTPCSFMRENAEIYYLPHMIKFANFELVFAIGAPNWSVETQLQLARKDVEDKLTPKGPLSLRGTNGISGKYLRACFLSWFFEFFLEDRKTDYIHGIIIYFSIGTQEQKLCPNKLKIGDRGLQKKFKIWIWIFWISYYID